MSRKSVTVNSSRALADADHVARLGALEPRVEGDDDPADRSGTERRDRPFVDVRRPDRDPVAGSTPLAIEGTSSLVDLVGELW